MLYGEPHKKNLGPYGLDCVWLDEQRGMQLELIPGKESFEIEICAYTPQLKPIARFNPDGTQPEGEQALTPELKSLKDLCSTMFCPQEEACPSAQLVFESDGEGGSTASVVKDAETSDIWEVHIDPADFVRADGGMRDRTGTLTASCRSRAGALRRRI